MIRTLSLVRGLLAGVVATLTVGVGQAGLLPVSVSVIPETENFRWTYAIVLPTDMQLQSGNYFTIYDFEGYIAGGDSAPEGWTFSAARTGPTPERLDPNDNPEVFNLTWRYNGPTVPSGQIGLGNFWAVSEFSDVGTDSFTARTNRTSDGLIDSNITETEVPVRVAGPTDPNLVPEPTTFVLAALGLPLVGLIRARRKK